MHDPMVVAFDVPRPWPRRERTHDSIRPHAARRVHPRWEFRMRHKCTDCTPDEIAGHGPNPFPWWKPSSWQRFWTVAGRGYYWPSLITIWHREPGGHDSGEVCKHYTRTQDAAGKWVTHFQHGWRWHVHHWRIQVGPLQTLRRWALTRCAWCGGRSVKGDRVNISHQWHSKRGRWWRGEAGLFHQDCSSIERAHASCTCADPLTEHNGYGRCLRCGKFRAYGQRPAHVATDLILSGIPKGHRDPEVYATVCRIWKSQQREEAVS